MNKHLNVKDIVVNYIIFLIAFLCILKIVFASVGYDFFGEDLYSLSFISYDNFSVFIRDIKFLTSETNPIFFYIFAGGVSKVTSYISTNPWAYRILPIISSICLICFFLNLRKRKEFQEGCILLIVFTVLNSSSSFLLFTFRSYAFSFPLIAFVLVKYLFDDDYKNKYYRIALSILPLLHYLNFLLVSIIVVMEFYKNRRYGLYNHIKKTFPIILVSFFSFVNLLYLLDDPYQRVSWIPPFSFDYFNELISGFPFGYAFSVKLFYVFILFYSLVKLYLTKRTFFFRVLSILIPWYLVFFLPFSAVKLFPYLDFSSVFIGVTVVIIAFKDIDRLWLVLFTFFLFFTSVSYKDFLVSRRYAPYNNIAAQVRDYFSFQAENKISLFFRPVLADEYMMSKIVKFMGRSSNVGQSSEDIKKQGVFVPFREQDLLCNRCPRNLKKKMLLDLERYYKKYKFNYCIVKDDYKLSLFVDSKLDITSSCEMYIP